MNIFFINNGMEFLICTIAMAVIRAAIVKPAEYFVVRK